MREYAARSLYRLYLLLFWPTKFERDRYGAGTKGFLARFSEFVELAAWIALVSGAGIAVAGAVMILTRAGDTTALAVWSVWLSALIGALSGAARGLLLGSASFAARNWLYGGALSAALCAGVFWDEPRDETFLLGLAFVFMFAATAGLSAGTAGGVRTGLTVGPGVGALMALGFGACAGAPVGLALGAVFLLTYWVYYFRLPLYPAQVALMGAALVAARLRPGTTARALRWTPLGWDEVAWLPLPFADQLLIDLARRDRPAGLDWITFVARERVLQRWAAERALEELLLDDLRVSAVADMPRAAGPGTLAAAPDVPPDLRDGLTAFARAAGFVDQYLAFQNAHRRAASLGHALGALEAVERRLVFAREGRYADPLRRAAGRWAAILRAEQQGLEASRGAPELPNPFVFGNPIRKLDSGAFVGRAEVARQLVGGILGSVHPPALLLHGARRMGKSSVLYQLPRLLGPNFARALVDCQNPAARESEGGFLRAVAQAVGDGLKERGVVAPDLTRAELAGHPHEAFGDWLDRTERVLPEGLRVLVCVDEYEALNGAVRGGWGGRVLDHIRHLIQHRPRLLWLFAGAHTFADLGPAWTSRFVSVRRVRISFLSADELRPLLTDRPDEPGFDLTYAPGAVDDLLARTNGQPNLAQAVAYELVEYLNEGQRRHATVEDVGEAVRRALVSGCEYFNNMWDDTDPVGRRALTAIAAGSPVPDVPATLAALRERDILATDNTFAVPMVRDWVRGVASGDTPQEP